MPIKTIFLDRDGVINKDKNYLYKEDDFDSVNDKWIREVTYPKLTIPSPQESFEVYKDIMTISKNKSFIQISMEHQSPFIAKKWTELIITEINRTMRFEDKSRTSKSIDFLNTKIIDANFSEIKDLMAQLLKQEIQKLTLLEVNKNYVFEFIDPPSVQEEKIEPQRALICIFGFFIGIFIGITYLFLFNIKNNN